MNALSHRLLAIASEYRAALMLGGVIAGLGLMMSPPPHNDQEMDAALRRVYSIADQPQVCRPERTPPTR